ncbi:MAG TPA: hypothetical protein VG734_20465 [Lacunisphaera sp.]|nr:hypothetical protein [Lacunisphaera sp.]
MPTLTVSSALMKARFSSFSVTLDSVVPAPGSGLRIGAGLPMPVGGAQLAGQSQAVSPVGLNRPGIGAIGAATPPPAPTGTPMQCPPALFKAASNHKLDCEFQQSMHDELNKFFEAICAGFSFGMSHWKLSASFTGVTIMGPMAMGGKIEAPWIDSQVIQGTNVAFGGPMTEWAKALVEGAARGFANKWKELGDNTRVPGLPWYPAFACFPGPMAPPMPNVPCPLMALAPRLDLVGAGALKDEMMRKAPNGTLYAEKVFTAVSDALSTGLMQFISTQMITLAMGRGSVPSFAPPYVPVGPVVGGDILPGCRVFTT